MGKTPDFQVPMSTELFIDGQFVAGEGEAERVLNPATGEVIAQVPEASYEQIHKAVLGASRAFDTWSETTPMERSRLLLKVADAIEQRAEQFARLESLNCGKPYARALEDEIPAIVDCFRFFAGAARCMTARRDAWDRGALMVQISLASISAMAAFENGCF